MACNTLLPVMAQRIYGIGVGEVTVKEEYVTILYGTHGVRSLWNADGESTL